jgi:DnaJ-domain-containing protein 1
MLTEKFIQFIKTEFKDFWAKYDPKQASVSEQAGFDLIYSIYMGKSHKTPSAEEKKRAYQQYRQYRQPKTNHKIPNPNTPTAQEAKYYDALELKAGATFDQIKTAYKQAVKKYHPDRFAQDKEKQQIAQQLTQKINEAYQYFEKKFQQ